MNIIIQILGFLGIKPSPNMIIIVIDNSKVKRLKYYRITYEYDEGGECLLSEKDLEMIAYPNPSAGNIEIQSNLLAAPNAEIRVFSVLG
ncbi:MAG: hypothetical protein ACI9XO_004454 [Paraglaciecola sp.]